ncbi:MAG: DUF1203 domain-containing protein [Rhodospirillales bacterium]
MDFRISGLPVAPFAPLFGQSEAALAARDIKRYVAAAGSQLPCRVSMVEAAAGESVLLLQYEHQPAASPYRSAGPIYVREAAREAFSAVNVLPDLVRKRLLSVRAYDEAGMMLEAEVIEGTQLEPLIDRLFAIKGVEYLHAHNARRGCSSCRIDRA